MSVEKTNVAVVLPNHNHAQYLGQALTALHLQTRPADEIIVIDDASTDNSLELLAAWQPRLPQMKIIRHARREGVVPTLNQGIAAATTDLVACGAADDLVAPRFLEVCAGLLDAHPTAAFAVGAAAIIDEHDRLTGLRPIMMPSTRPGFVSADVFRRLLRRGDNFFLGNVTVYRRSRLMELGGFDVALGSMSDGLMARRLATRSGFCFAPELLGVWRISSAQTNYSVSQVTAHSSFTAMVQSALSVIETEPRGLFPDGYSAMLTRRLRFGRARLLIGNGSLMPTARESIIDMLGGEPLDRRMVGVADHLGPLRNLALLGWATYRLRPFSLAALAVEPMRRKIALRHWDAPDQLFRDLQPALKHKTVP